MGGGNKPAVSTGMRALAAWTRKGAEDPDPLSQPEPDAPSEPGSLKVFLGKPQLLCYRGALADSFLQGQWAMSP